jgi:hypothetical protein
MNGAKIFISIFVGIFCLIGFWLVREGVVGLLNGGSTYPLVTLFSGLAFAGSGVAVYMITNAGAKAQARESALCAAHPEEPWLWREDWANGRVKNSERGTALFLWGFGVLWNLITAPMIYFMKDEFLKEGNFGAFIALLFPLAGIGVIAFAVRKTIQARKFGDCSFLMTRVPGVLGGDVGGTILVPRGMSTGEQIVARLSCVHIERRRSGKNTSTDETVLWQSEDATLSLAPMLDGSVQGASVRFNIPYDASPTGQIDNSNWIKWRLAANASVPGVDFVAGFELPVFKTRDSAPEHTEEKLRSEEVSAGVQPVLPGPDASFDVSTGPKGGIQFILKGHGKFGQAAPAILFGLVFVGVSVFIGELGAPFLFTLVFGVIALFVILLSLFGVYGQSRILIDAGNVTVANSLFGFTMSKQIPCSSITKIGVRTQAQKGNNGQHSIVFTLTGGKTAFVFQSLRNRLQADWFAEELRRTMAPWRSSKNSEKEEVR